MRIYIEAFEILEETATELPDSIRIDITDLTEQERKEVLEAIREHFAGKKYRIQIHCCYHDEGKPCEVKIIEVKE